VREHARVLMIGEAGAAQEAIVELKAKRVEMEQPWARHGAQAEHDTWNGREFRLIQDVVDYGSCLRECQFQHLVNWPARCSPHFGQSQPGALARGRSHSSAR